MSLSPQREGRRGLFWQRGEDTRETEREGAREKDMEREKRRDETSSLRLAERVL